MGRWAKARERLLMLGRPIALVLGKAIARTLPVEIDHDPVAGDLGDDGGRGDRKALAVAFDDRLCQAGKLGRAVASSEQI